MSKDLEEALINASKMIAKEGGCPQDVWHPDFGWVIRNGQPTENSEAFYNWLMENKDTCKKE